MSAPRDKTIDGFRAIAALGVVTAHAVDYRFVAAPGLHYARRLADPLALTSVQLFFVISGYIITSLLIRERETRGQISIPAFYVRRVCRIVPPLALYLATVAALRFFGVIDLDPLSLAMSTTFTCNIGECGWWVAHTWSLSVEEQYYLVWPMLLVLFADQVPLLLIGIAALLLGFLFAPFAWHSNYVSFVCIGAGALYASLPSMRRVVNSAANWPLWLLMAATLLLGPLYFPTKAMGIATPFLIVYLLFAAREIPGLVALLATRPFQIVGAASYSLYLWQQLFLGAKSTAPVLLLPVVVALSVWLVERPFIALGKKLSAGLLDKPRMALSPAATEESAPALHDR